MDLLQFVLSHLDTVLGFAIGFGLGHVLAAGLRKLWAKVKGDVAKSPNKLDDAALALVNKNVEAVIDHIDNGNASEAKAVLAVILSLLPKPATK